MMAVADTEEKALIPVPPGRKAVATALIMAATVLVVVDSTIANVVLPHMQSALGATPETITWVLTSYVLASAIGTPITGWLTGRFGRTRFFAMSPGNMMSMANLPAVCGPRVRRSTLSRVASAPRSPSRSWPRCWPEISRLIADDRLFRRFLADDAVEHPRHSCGVLPAAHAPAGRPCASHGGLADSRIAPRGFRA